MYIGMKDLKKLFEKNSFLVNPKEPCCLIGYHFIENVFPPYKEHFLYVLTDIRQLDIVKDHSDLNLLILVDSETFPEKTTFCDISANMLFVKNYSEEQIVRMLDDFFDFHCGIALYSDLLLNTLLNGNSIQTLIQESFSLFQNPIFVFDDSFYLIASTKKEAEETGYFSALLKNRWIPNKIFNYIYRHSSYIDTAITLSHPEHPFQMIICPISTSEKLGYIIICETNRSFRSFDYELLEIMRTAIYQQYTKETFYKDNSGFNVEFFIRDLLDEKIAIGTKNIDQINHLHPGFSGNIYCIVVDISRSTQPVNTFFIRKLFENAVPGTKTLIYHGQIVIVIKYDRNSFMLQKHLDRLQMICIQHDLFAGLSNCFFDIIQIREYYKQAMRAIEIGTSIENTPCIYRYSDYYLTHAANVFYQNESLDTFCHPKMKILLSYDQKNHTHLAETLYTYLVYERNVLATASVIHIHRNTLTSRLKCIDSLVTINYENPLERQYLIISYNFYKYVTDASQESSSEFFNRIF